MSEPSRKLTKVECSVCGKLVALYWWSGRLANHACHVVKEQLRTASLATVGDYLDVLEDLRLRRTAIQETIEALQSVRGQQ